MNTNAVVLKLFREYMFGGIKRIRMNFKEEGISLTRAQM
jgi:hypothetical protein